MTHVRGWVWRSNVQTAIEYIGMVIGYSVDESDTQAILLGVEASDADEERWYTYPLVGDPVVEVHLALNPGAAPVDIKVVGPLNEVQEASVDTILALLAEVGDRS